MDGLVKNIEGIFTQNKVQLFFFLGIGIAFSLLVLWMFLFRQDIPDKLMQMTLAVWSMLWAGIAKGIGKIETLINKDLNGDGVIGASVNSANSVDLNDLTTQSNNTTEVANVVVAETPVTEITTLTPVSSGVINTNV